MNNLTKKVFVPIIVVIAGFILFMQYPNFIKGKSTLGMRSMALLSTSPEKSTQATLFMFSLTPTIGDSPYPSMAPSQLMYKTLEPGIHTYFVSPNGNDGNSGTQARPWRTITRAAEAVIAGDVVYVYGGVYREKVALVKSGTQDAPIKILAISGETPVIDGSELSIPVWSALLNLYGDWINVNGFEVRNSEYIGIAINGRHNIVDGVYSHHNQKNGILIAGDYGIVQNSKIYRNALSNEYGKSNNWAGGVNAAREQHDGITDNAIIRNNIVWENWGEGISTFEATGTLIENNLTHDNFAANIYISDATDVVCQGNLVFMDPNSYVAGRGDQVGIEMGDEKYIPISANIKVINNIVYGNRRNLYWWKGVKGGAMNNVLIANNNFLNSTEFANVIISQADHIKVRFQNNIVEQDGTLPIMKGSTNIIYTNNLWSKEPPSVVVGTGDVIGDPGWIKDGSQFTADWYRLLPASLAIGRGTYLTDVTSDYFGKTRGSHPDIGAIENR